MEVKTRTTTVSVRQADDRDVAAVIEMGLRFLESSVFQPWLRFLGDPHAHLRMLVNLVRQHGVLLVAEAQLEERGPTVLLGFFAGTALPHPFTGERFLDEVAWWVEPDARGLGVGKELVQAAEDWACSESLHMVRFVAPRGSTVGQFYERAGYEAIETAYHKRL